MEAGAIMKILAFSFAILFFAGVASAQAAKTISLKHGQQKTAKTGRIVAKFLAVTEDSRCPENVRCIWAGVAKIKLQLRKNGKTAEVELDTNQLDKSAIFEGHEIKLTSLTPYPKTSSPIAKAAYIATITIGKQKK